MIYFIEFTKGFPLDLPTIGKKRFEFKKGINVLYSANGTGKSVILNTIKGYCGIKTGGWTQQSDPSIIGLGMPDLRFFPPPIRDFPHLYSIYTPSGAEANVGWDGVPTFYNKADIKVNEVFFYHNVGQSDDGITSDQEQFDALINKPSSGQYRSQKINKVFNMLGNGAPREEIDKQPYLNKKMGDRELKYWKFLRSHGEGPSTVLLDEPESALSLPKQKILLTELIPQHMKDYQVIMASHSIFALTIPNANIIDLQDGYVDECKTVLKGLNIQ